MTYRKWFVQTVVLLLLLMCVGGCAQNSALREYAENMPLATSYFCTLAVKDDNSLWFWGGSPDEYHVSSPQKVADDIKAVVPHFGEYISSLLLKTNGELYEIMDIEDIDSASKIMENVRQIAGGYAHYMILQKDGSLWIYGRNDQGQLGNGKIETDAGNSVYFEEPTKIMSNVCYIAAGSASSYAITTNNILWGWGANGFGQIGDGTTENVLKPKKIMDNIAIVSAGSEQILALKKDGALWGCGANVSGPFGNFTESPVLIISNVRFTSAAYGGKMVVKTDKSLWAWGSYQPKSADIPLDIAWDFDSDEILGLYVDIRDNEPEQIMSDVIYATTGVLNSFVVKSDGSLWAWGGNVLGELGDGTQKTRMEPIKIMDGLRLPPEGVTP